jgi:hypothetical protein
MRKKCAIAQIKINLAKNKLKFLKELTSLNRHSHEKVIEIIALNYSLGLN